VRTVGHVTLTLSSIGGFCFMVTNRTSREWRFASLRLVPLGILAIIGATVASTHSYPRPTTLKGGTLAILGALLFLFSSVSFLNVLTRTANKIFEPRMGLGKASMLRFIIRLVGSFVIILILLASIHISVTNLLLGSAIIGIILSAAAQQTLANFFASVVLVIDRPFAVGQTVTLNSGALGGLYTGKVLDISFSHTRLRLEDNSTVRLPNATILSGAAVIHAAPQPIEHRE